MNLLINKLSTAFNGAQVQVHAIRSVELSADFDALVVRIDSWANEAARVAGHPAAAQSQARIPLASVGAADLANAIAGALTTDGWLAGGSRYWNDQTSLDQIKVAKNAEINASRLRANRSGFQYGGKTFATDELSMFDIMNTANLVARLRDLPPGWVGGWKALDNTVLPIPDVATWDAFYAAMYAAGLANFAKAQALKAQLAAATTPEQVAAVAW